MRSKKTVTLLRNHGARTIYLLMQKKKKKNTRVQRHLFLARCTISNTSGLKTTELGRSIVFRPRSRNKSKSRIDDTSHDWIGCFRWHDENPCQHISRRHGSAHDPKVRPKLYRSARDGNTPRTSLDALHSCRRPPRPIVYLRRQHPFFHSDTSDSRSRPVGS